MTKKTKILSVLCVFFVVFSCFCYVKAEDNLIFFYDFEGVGDQYSFVDTIYGASSSVLVVDTATAFEGSFHLRCITGSAVGAKAFNRKEISPLTEVYAQVMIKWGYGYPGNQNPQGIVVFGAGNVTNGGQFNVIIFNDNGNYCWGVRYDSGGWSTVINASSSVSLQEYYMVEFRVSQSAYSLWINGVLVLSESGLNICPWYSYVFCGNSYNLGGTNTVYFDNIKISDEYIGEDFPFPSQDLIYFVNYDSAYDGMIITEDGAEVGIVSKGGVYDGGFHLHCVTSKNPGGKGFAYKHISPLTEVYVQSRVKWVIGEPFESDDEGLRVLGVGNGNDSSLFNVILYKHEGDYYYGVRYYSNGWITNLNLTSSAEIFRYQYYMVEFRVSQSAYSLWINGVLVLSESGLNICPSYSYVFCGNTYNLAEEIATSVFYDNLKVSSEYIGWVSPGTIYSNGFECEGLYGSTYDSGSGVVIEDISAYEGNYHLSCVATYINGAKAFAYKHISPLTEVYIQSRVKWVNGVPGHYQGLVILGAGNISRGGQCNVVIYSEPSEKYYWGVSYDSGGWTTTVNYSTSVNTGVYYRVELAVSQNSYCLWVDGVLVLSEGELNICPSYSYVFFGNTYNLGSANTVFYDMGKVSDEYIGEEILPTPTPNTNENYLLLFNIFPFIIICIPALILGYFYKAMGVLVGFLIGSIVCLGIGLIPPWVFILLLVGIASGVFIFKKYQI